jgi:cob(I)alamin adenosyltransferase
VTIYTRHGDKGQTRLLSGELVDKDDARVQTYGAVDELQAHLGMTIALTRSARVRALLREVQEDMIAVGAELASSGDPPTRRVGRDDAARLERSVDELTASHRLPDRFVRPGASPDSAAAHVARAVSRRCERLIVALNRAEGGLDDLIVYPPPREPLRGRSRSRWPGCWPSRPRARPRPWPCRSRSRSSTPRAG